MMAWKILNFKSIGKGTIVGSFDLEVPPMMRWCLDELEKIAPATGAADPAPEDDIPF